MTQKRDARHQPQSITSVPKATGVTTPSSVDPSVYSSLFVGMVLSMSWQLAIVVIVPIVGGHVLDQHLHSSPVFTLVGLVIAMLATCGVLWRTLRSANSKVAALEPKDGKK